MVEFMSLDADQRDNIWKNLINAFPILKGENALTPDKEALKQAFDVIKQYDISKSIIHLLRNKIDAIIRQEIIPNACKGFEERSSAMEYFHSFHNTIEKMYSSVLPLKLAYEAFFESFATILIIPNPDEDIRLMLCKELILQLPTNYKTTVENFYKVSFGVYHHEDNNSSMDNSSCNGCGNSLVDCECTELVTVFDDANRYLFQLGLFEPMVEFLLTSLIYSVIEKHIVATCKGNYGVSYVDKLEQWLNDVVIRWLTRIYTMQVKQKLNEIVTRLRRKLIIFVYEIYTKTRIDELFNIIIDYPDSVPALEDLNRCLPGTQLKLYLTEVMKSALKARLLHLGVSTPDILIAYVATVRSFRILDPSGVLLDEVTHPIHQYLRSRDNTVRCFVNSLTEEGPNDLADELARADSLTGEEDDAHSWESWMPEPVVLDPKKSLNTQRTSDIISMLVNVYGSKEMFLNEYRNMLADRLLSPSAGDTEKEIRYLELLKLRFGESNLHSCEVMVKDVGDSRRLNAVLKTDAEYLERSAGFPLSALIVSAIFWPPFKEDVLELPPEMASQLEHYTKAFERQKGNRTLSWKPLLGHVELELELKNQTASFTVSPVRAAIIHHFQDQDQWHINDLSQKLKVPTTVLRKKISFWQSQGVLLESEPGLFVLVEDRKTAAEVPEVVCDDDDLESAMVSSKDRREEELQVFWSYIIGMLTNIDSMPLERIHQMLKMFVSEGTDPIECSLEELHFFLESKVRDHRLVFSGGRYHLPKS